MNGKQIILVKRSFAKIEPLAEEAAVLFYARLFDLDSSLRQPFKSDINQQGQKLMQMIGLAVEGLDRIEELVPAVRELGARHLSYGVKDHHYETVATALMWTFEKALGKDFDAKTQEAWGAVYNLLAQTMKESPHLSH